MKRETNLNNFSLNSTTVNENDSKRIFSNKKSVFSKKNNPFKSIKNFKINSERKLSFNFSDRKKKKIKKIFSGRKLSFENTKKKKKKQI